MVMGGPDFLSRFNKRLIRRAPIRRRETRPSSSGETNKGHRQQTTTRRQRGLVAALAFTLVHQTPLLCPQHATMLHLDPTPSLHPPSTSLSPLRSTVLRNTASLPLGRAVYSIQQSSGEEAIVKRNQTIGRRNPNARKRCDFPLSI